MLYWLPMSRKDFYFYMAQHTPLNCLMIQLGWYNAISNDYLKSMNICILGFLWKRYWTKKTQERNSPKLFAWNSLQKWLFSSKFFTLKIHLMFSLFNVSPPKKKQLLFSMENILRKLSLKKLSPRSRNNPVWFL